MHGSHRILAAAFGCLALALFAACGGDDDSDDNRAPTPDASGSVSSPSATTAADSALKEQLMLKLLGVEDLPDGWVLVSTDEHPHRGSVFCDTPFEAGTTPLFRLTRVFQKGERGAILSQRISAYPEGGAEAAMQAFRDATENCDEWTKITDDGSQTWKLLPLEIESYGDDMISLDLPSTIGSVTIDNHFVMIREGDAITILGYGGPFVDPIDPDVTEDFARRAAAKLESAEG